jgi:hypothetical protein
MVIQVVYKVNCIIGVDVLFINSVSIFEAAGIKQHGMIVWPTGWPVIAVI